MTEIIIDGMKAFVSPLIIITPGDYTMSRETPAFIEIIGTGGQLKRMRPVDIHYFTDEDAALLDEAAQIKAELSTAVGLTKKQLFARLGVITNELASRYIF